AADAGAAAVATAIVAANAAVAVAVAAVANRAGKSKQETKARSLPAVRMSIEEPSIRSPAP
ncbi:MAG: hypothetical protein ACRD5G_05545, partial [Candidatus Acidiferrales bacterium]